MRLSLPRRRPVAEFADVIVTSRYLPGLNGGWAVRARAKTAFVVGMGQLGSVFADALRGTDHDVAEVRRGDDLAALCASRAVPDVVVVAVGEDDLDAVLAALPSEHRARAVLVQNELVPARWRRAGAPDPTIAIVWFERKAGRPPREILPTRIAGPAAVTIAEALERAGLAAEVLPRAALGDELVAKNAYILVTNVAGLAVGGTTGDLLREHAGLREALLDEVLTVQRALVDIPFADGAVRERVLDAMRADEAHGNAGRTARARAERLLAHADAHGFSVPTVRAIVRAP